jgi:hypothetical protein
MLRRSFIRGAVALTGILAMVAMAVSPANASAIPGTMYCHDSTSASGTQKARICVYFEWTSYFPNGYPEKYHVFGSIAGYAGIGSSKLQIIRVGMQKCYYNNAYPDGCNWQDFATTNPSYPKVSYSGYVTHDTPDYVRTSSTDSGGCPQYRAVISWRIDFTSGGYRTGFYWGPGWFGSCWS